MTDLIRLERTIAASPERVWELWTTPQGIEAWWAPDGFEADVSRLDLEPGGELVYTFTATAPEQVRFLEQAGLPLATEARKTFVDVDPPRRLTYQSVIDFVPDREPYQHLTVVEMEPAEGGVRVVESFEPMHDDVWTQRIRDGRENELDNLAKVA